MNNKIKYEIEYTFNTSPKVLFSRLGTASGLSEWFADDVTLRNNLYTFSWNGSEQVAELISKKENDHVRFHWTDEDDDSYFEFSLRQDSITGDMALIIVDFADDEEEKIENIELWNTQIKDLKRILGL